MVAAVAGFIGAAIQVVKWIGAPIKRQFTYLCCFTSNITTLRNEAEKLQVTAGDLQGKVDRARDDVRVISGEAEIWLKEYDDIKSDTDGILIEVPTVESGCLKLVARFSLSKRAKETADRSKEFRDQCKFEEAAISQPGPPAATKAVPLPATYHEFDSRKQIEEDIMATLRGGDVNIMGICGMGGVGKTTVAGRIRNKALENNVFNEALMVVVSQPVDKFKIQLEIGRSLGLKKLEKESLESRRQKLYERLSGTKRILLILDDVWKNLELEEGMAETVAGILGPAVGDVLKWMGAQIKRQFTYLCCFSSNITSLRNEAQELEANTGDLERRANHARDNVCVISGKVEDWLKKSDDIKSETDGILNEVPTVESGCLKLGARFSLSRRAMKTTARSKEHRERNKFKDDDIALPGSPAARRPVLLPATYEFESRKRIEEDIMTTLRGGDVTIMGICGMGGLGKTTMAKRIMNEALESKVFDEVVMVVVSQPVDKLKIQLEICGSLGLKKLDEESLQSRVQKLHERLSGTKRILLVLDDVWENLELEEVGIPCKHKGCTVLITSRNMNVFTTMNVKKVFGMEELTEEDAWILFRGKIGTCGNDNKLNSIAKDLVKKCRGLPLALTTLGAALKYEHDVRLWRNALRELEKGQPGIPKYIEDVYNPLKLSYDFLEFKEHKLVFLLCGLYPEDADIPIEDLTYFSLGLGIFEGGIVKEARDSMYTWTRILKNRSLLLDSDRERDGDDYVRMHDVVRDVCKFIAKQEGHDFPRISSSKSYELPTTFTFQNLLLLLIHGNKAFLDSSFLEGIKDIHVLSIERLLLMSLPCTTQSLKSLKTLVLDRCRGLETLSVVGELVNLEILICRRCDSIKELPPEMKQLNLLKVLDLSWCYNLERIGGGIISSLVALEELKMLESFNKWEEGENARLRELEELKMLSCLEIEIQNPAALRAAENMLLPSELDRFDIRIGTPKFNLFLSDKGFCHNSFELKLRCKEKIYLGHWIETQLLPHTEVLSLIGGNVNYFAKCQKLRYLELGDCEMLKESFIMPVDGLEHLKLSTLPKLEKIWNDDRVSSNSFQNLKKLQLDDLPSLKNFGNDCLPQMEDLRIENCVIMEQVFLESQNSHNITKVFPKLKNVELYDLPNLTSFYQGIEGIEFPELINLDIRRCAKMRRLVSKRMESNENTHIQNLSCQEGFCGSLITSSISENLVSLTKPTTKQHMNGDQRILSFPKLETLSLEYLRELGSFCEWKYEGELPSLRELRIEHCSKMKQVWNRSSIHQHNQTKDCLPKLQFLRISKCEMMEQVFLWKGESSNSHPVTKMFPKLEEVYLKDLPKLTSFYQGIEGIEFPKLETLHLENLNEVVSFWQWKCEDELPSLSNVTIKNCSKMKQVWKYSSGHQLNQTKDCLPELKVLHISQCKIMEQVFLSKREHKNSSPSPNSHPVTKMFPKLKQVYLREMQKLTSFYQGIEDIEFPQLTELEIKRCANMRSLVLKGMESNENNLGGNSSNEGSTSFITSSITGNLYNLTKMIIEDGGEMAHVITYDEKKVMSGGESNLLQFPKLQGLILRSLPKLISFCKCKCDVGLPLLREVAIGSCPNMKNLTLGSLNAPYLESFDTDMDNYLQVPFNSTKKLIFNRCENLLNCDRIDVSHFNGLGELTISFYKGSMGFFSSSIIGYLVNLTALTIQFCDEMVKVIEDEDEKENVESSGQRRSLFPQLHRLRLEHLPKLVNFCNWKCDVELLSLMEVRIRGCNNMKRCTLGYLATPKLESVLIDYISIVDVMDLNGVLKQEEDEDEEEEEEDEDPSASLVPTHLNYIDIRLPGFGAGSSNALGSASGQVLPGFAPGFQIGKGRTIAAEAEQVVNLRNVPEVEQDESGLDLSLRLGL